MSGLAKTGDDVRLRVALVEDGVAYKGASGLARHSGVVRHMPGGADGGVFYRKVPLLRVFEAGSPLDHVEALAEVVRGGGVRTAQ